MAKRQRLTLQQVLDEIFMDLPHEDDKEDHLEEDYSDSNEHSPELDEEVPNEVTDTRNEPVCSDSTQRFGFHPTGRGGCGRIQGSFALLLCHFLILQLNSEKEYPF